MSKETIKSVLAEANKEIVEGKSNTIKNKFQQLIGKRDGMKAKLAMIIKNWEVDIKIVDDKIKYFENLSLDDAFNEIIYSETNDCIVNNQVSVTMGSDGYSTYVVKR